MVNIRRVEPGDESHLAYIQTESWKEAFKDIIPADTLSRCTGLERATAMYKKLLDENKGNGYILELEIMRPELGHAEAAELGAKIGQVECCEEMKA